MPIADGGDVQDAQDTTLALLLLLAGIEEDFRGPRGAGFTGLGFGACCLAAARAFSFAFRLLRSLSGGVCRLMPRLLYDRFCFCA